MIVGGPAKRSRIATRDAVGVLRIQDLGSIEQGKLADLVLLGRNPVEDSHKTEKVWRTVKAGRIFDLDRLRRRE